LVEIKTFGKKTRHHYIKREGVYGVAIKGDLYAVAGVRDTHFLVGGGLEDNESHEECLKREFLEEVGHSIELLEYVDVFREFGQSFRSKRYYELIGYVYRVKIKDCIALGEADHTLKWMTKDELKNQMALSYQAHVIQEVL